MYSSGRAWSRLRGEGGDVHDRCMTGGRGGSGMQDAISAALAQPLRAEGVQHCRHGSEVHARAAPCTPGAGLCLAAPAPGEAATPAGCSLQRILPRGRSGTHMIPSWQPSRTSGAIILFAVVDHRSAHDERTCTRENEFLLLSAMFTSSQGVSSSAGVHSTTCEEMMNRH